MKRALLVGVDDYEHFSGLSGCVNDVVALSPLLARDEDGAPNFSCETRTSAEGPIDRDSFLADLDTLLSSGADVALLYFAGHGSVDGEIATDVTLSTTDGTTMTPGVALSQIMAKVASSPVKEIILVLDCCFAGAAAGVPQLASSFSSLRSGVSILAASRGDQTSAETPDGRGLFSTYLCGGLEGGAADVLGKVTVAGLYAYLDESFGAWEQRPVFKANVERLHELRRCDPALPLVQLRQLPELFVEADTEFALDPSYEPEAAPEHAEHEAAFAVLQKLRAAKLVEPIGEAHMYFAAMNSTGCRLTRLGQHYWKLAQRGQI
jgi:uncharacterized caspase-like protein